MSHYKILINTDNAAFEGEGRDQEVARILRKLADALERGPQEGSLYDINGNKVGSVDNRNDEED